MVQGDCYLSQHQTIGQVYGPEVPVHTVEGYQYYTYTISIVIGITPTSIAISSEEGVYNGQTCAPAYAQTIRHHFTHISDYVSVVSG